MKVPWRGNERFGAKSRFPHWDARTLYPGLVSRVPSRAVAGIPGMLDGFASNVAVVNIGHRLRHRLPRQHGQPAATYSLPSGQRKPNRGTAHGRKARFSNRDRGRLLCSLTL